VAKQEYWLPKVVLQQKDIWNLQDLIDNGETLQIPLMYHGTSACQVEAPEIKPYRTFNPQSRVVCFFTKKIQQYSTEICKFTGARQTMVRLGKSL
jgi:hypothetical protein